MRWLALALVLSLTSCGALVEFLGTKTGLATLAGVSAAGGAQLLGGSSCDVINLTAELQALSPQNVIIGVDPGGDKEYRLTVNGSIGKTVCECNPASMILSTADGLRLGEPNVLLVGRDECFSNQVTIHVPAGTGGGSTPPPSGSGITALTHRLEACQPGTRDCSAFRLFWDGGQRPYEVVMVRREDNEVFRQSAQGSGLNLFDPDVPGQGGGTYSVTLNGVPLREDVRLTS